MLNFAHDTRLLTPAEAAPLLRLHEVTVRRLLRQGKLPGVKTGREWRISAATLHDFLTAPPLTGNRGPAARSATAA